MIGIRRDWFKPDTSLEGRLRLLVATVLLALPLAAAIWAFAAYAGRTAEDHADGELAAFVRGGSQEYSGVLDAAQGRAVAAAARRDVQLALSRSDRGTLTGSPVGPGWRSGCAVGRRSGGSRRRPPSARSGSSSEVAVWEAWSRPSSSTGG